MDGLSKNTTESERRKRSGLSATENYIVVNPWYGLGPAWEGGGKTNGGIPGPHF